MRQRQIDRHAIFVGQAWLADNDRAEIFCHFFCHIVAGGVNEITRYGSDFVGDERNIRNIVGYPIRLSGFASHNTNITAGTF